MSMVEGGIKLKGKPFNISIIYIYTRDKDQWEEEVESFYV